MSEEMQKERLCKEGLCKAYRQARKRKMRDLAIQIQRTLAQIEKWRVWHE